MSVFPQVAATVWRILDLQMNRGEVDYAAWVVRRRPCACFVAVFFLTPGLPLFIHCNYSSIVTVLMKLNAAAVLHDGASCKTFQRQISILQGGNKPGVWHSDGSQPEPLCRLLLLKTSGGQTLWGHLLSWKRFLWRLFDALSTQREYHLSQIFCHRYLQPPSVYLIPRHTPPCSLECK